MRPKKRRKLYELYLKGAVLELAKEQRKAQRRAKARGCG